MILNRYWFHSCNNLVNYRTNSIVILVVLQLNHIFLILNSLVRIILYNKYNNSRHTSVVNIWTIFHWNRLINCILSIRRLLGHILRKV